MQASREGEHTGHPEELYILQAICRLFLSGDCFGWIFACLFQVFLVCFCGSF